MEPIPPALLAYPNRMGHYFCQYLIEIISKNSANALFLMAGLADYRHELPPENDEPGFDIAILAMLNAALEQFGGHGLGRGIAKRAGMGVLYNHITEFGPTAPLLTDEAFQSMDLQQKLHHALPLILQVVTSYRPDHPIELHEDGDGYRFSLDVCPVCYGRKADNTPGRFKDQPICNCIMGMVSGGLWRLTGEADFQIEETRCKGQGAEVCEFKVYKTLETTS